MGGGVVVFHFLWVYVSSTPLYCLCNLSFLMKFPLPFKKYKCSAPEEVPDSILWTVFNWVICDKKDFDGVYLPDLIRCWDVSFQMTRTVKSV